MQQTQIKGLLGITMKIELVLFLILLSLNTVNKKPGLSVHSSVFTMVMGEVLVLSFLGITCINLLYEKIHFHGIQTLQ